MGESVCPVSEWGKLCDNGVKTAARTSSIYSLWTTNHLKGSKKVAIPAHAGPQEQVGPSLYHQYLQ